MSNAAESRPEVAIKGLSGSLLGRSWAVRSGRVLEFGRNLQESSGIEAVQIHDRRVSSRHCRIDLENGGPRITDLDSANGVRLNGRRIPRGASRPLSDGDIVALADVNLEVCFENARHATMLSHSKTVTVAGLELDQLMIDLMPFPVAAAVRSVCNAIEPVECVGEIVRGFEAVLRFQTLLALSELLATADSRTPVEPHLASLRQRPFSLGRWLELHSAVVAALCGDGRMVVTELATWNDNRKDAQAWRAAANRIIELRNDLVHRDGLRAESAEYVLPELQARFGQIVLAWSFYVGYEFITVESGTWSDTAGTFEYPCRSLLGSTTPFARRSLASPNPLPPGVPLVLSRNGKRRLSLAPFQLVAPGQDRQVHWFSLSECKPTRSIFVSYPASFEKRVSTTDPLVELLTGKRGSSRARANFSGRLS